MQIFIKKIKRQEKSRSSNLTMKFSLFLFLRYNFDRCVSKRGQYIEKTRRQ